MVSKLSSVLSLLLFFPLLSSAQSSSYDSLKTEIINLNLRVDEVELNLQEAKQKFQSSILIATIGYTTTITGGLMLGRKNDQLGQTLLVAGGATGLIGTYKMVDAFKYLTGKRKRKSK